MKVWSVGATILVGVLASNTVFSAPVETGRVIVAGSSLEAPPPFWEDSFWGITPSIDRAFPFDAQPFGPFWVDELQVAAYYSEGFASSSASFAIHFDDSGIPGGELTRFDVSGISMSQEVLTSVLNAPVLLESGARYWIVGSTTLGQVNWNLGDFTFGEAAFRVGGGEWQFLPDTNVSAFALVGEVVPEPSTVILLTPLIFLIRRRRRAKNPTAREQ